MAYPWAEPHRLATSMNSQWQSAGGGSIPYMRVEGSPFERGKQHGQEFRELIKRYKSVLAVQLNRHSLTLQGQLGDHVSPGESAEVNPEELCSRALAFLPAFEEWAPKVLEEIKGVAVGARVPLAEALLANVRGEVGNLTGPHEECSAFAVSRPAPAGRSVLVGQNSDQDPEIEALALVLHVVPDDAPQAIMFTFAGLVGYHGLNELGVAHGANSISVGTWRMGLPHYPFKRMMLERASLDEVLELASGLPLCSGGNYVVADGTGRIADLEILPAPDGVRVLEPERGLVVHTNHLLHPDFAPRDRLVETLPDSIDRLVELRAAFDSPSTDGLADAIAALRRHCEDDRGICRHEPRLKTVLSFVADATSGVLYACRGNPCTGSYARYGFAPETADDA
jgi:isopenicillin-N N-acyltransferase-like protein